MGKNSRHEEPNNQVDPRIPSGVDQEPVNMLTSSGLKSMEWDKAWLPILT